MKKKPLPKRAVTAKAAVSEKRDYTTKEDKAWGKVQRDWPLQAALTAPALCTLIPKADAAKQKGMRSALLDVLATNIAFHTAYPGQCNLGIEPLSAIAEEMLNDLTAWAENTSGSFDQRMLPHV